LSTYHVAVPYVQNKYFEPLVGYYSTKCIPVMEQMMQERNYKLPDLFSKIQVNKLMVERDFPDFKQNYFQSLNQPEDLEMLKGSHPDRP
jgi:molybdopterin-guanine dinucleotide biosynthesis protein A